MVSTRPAAPRGGRSLALVLAAAVAAAAVAAGCGGDDGAQKQAATSTSGAGSTTSKTTPSKREHSSSKRSRDHAHAGDSQQGSSGRQSDRRHPRRGPSQADVKACQREPGSFARCLLAHTPQSRLPKGLSRSRVQECLRKEKTNAGLARCLRPAKPRSD